MKNTWIPKNNLLQLIKINKIVMKYARQVQEHLDRLDQSLAVLRDYIKRGQNKEALHYMEQGELKDRFEELQNIVTISQVGQLGARGTQNTGTL